MGGHTLQKAATLLPRNVPRTVRVRPTKQGNGNPTKGALSLSIPPWHNAICSTYFRPVAFFRFYPRLFSTPRPHIIHSFQPLAPFLSPFFSPSSLDTSNNRGATSWPTRIFEDPCEAFGRHMFSGGAPLYRIAYVGIVNDNQRWEKRENIFQRYFREILFHRAIRRSVQSVILISSDIFYRQSHRSMCK